jgi:hypothetical protein
LKTEQFVFLKHSSTLHRFKDTVSQLNISHFLGGAPTVAPRADVKDVGTAAAAQNCSKTGLPDGTYSDQKFQFG